MAAGWRARGEETPWDGDCHWVMSPCVVISSTQVEFEVSSRLFERDGDIMRSECVRVCVPDLYKLFKSSLEYLQKDLTDDLSCVSLVLSLQGELFKNRQLPSKWFISYFGMNRSS